jgi:uncharacterized membrane protein
MVKESAAHCNAGFFSPVVVASGYFGYVGCKWLLMVLFGLLVVASLNVLAGAGVLLCVGCNRQSKQNQKQPRATQSHLNKTVGDPHNQLTRGNYNRRRENRITVSSRILNHNNLYT